MQEFYFQCVDCEHQIENQRGTLLTDCPKCHSHHLNVIYPTLSKKDFLHAFNSDEVGLRRYKKMLPIHDENNIISFGEGNMPLDRWEFLEDFAKESKGISCQVLAHRQDMNPKTGSFKDLAGCLVSSALKEAEVKNYVVASTGNIGAAFACYLRKARINLYVFIPNNSSRYKEAEIAAVGQTVFRVNGDYHTTKVLAKEFAKKNGFTLAQSGLDPYRVEAKKTMSYDWIKNDIVPSVYIQALSGGTGPFGVYKGCQELIVNDLLQKPPRFILCQSDQCAPMATSWLKAKSEGFQKDCFQSFDTIENPETEVATLATGIPSLYPKLAPIVKETGGEILSFPENLAPDLALWISSKSAVRIGPAATIGVGGFLSALKEGYIKDGDTVVINIGEGIRRDPGFLEKIVKDSIQVTTLKDLENFKDLEGRSQSIEDKMRNYIEG